MQGLDVRQDYRSVRLRPGIEMAVAAADIGAQAAVGRVTVLEDAGAPTSCCGGAPPLLVRGPTSARATCHINPGILSNAEPLLIGSTTTRFLARRPSGVAQPVHVSVEPRHPDLLIDGKRAPALAMTMVGLFLGRDWLESALTPAAFDATLQFRSDAARPALDLSAAAGASIAEGFDTDPADLDFVKHVVQGFRGDKKDQETAIRALMGMQVRLQSLARKHDLTSMLQLGDPVRRMAHALATGEEVGHRKFLDWLIEQNTPALSRAVGRRVREPERVKDIVQETFARATRRVERLAEHPSPSRWLHYVAQNIIIDDARKGVRDQSIAAETKAQRDAFGDAADLSDPLLVKSLAAAIKEPPERLREVMLLALQGLELKHIAKRLGISYATARRRRDEARARVRKAVFGTQ